MTAAILEDLTEEECYLWAILTDKSGLDQAEFTWYAADRPDGCFRAWPYQWHWWRDMSGKQIDQCARSVGKSLSIKVRSCSFGYVWPNSELVITAPESIHVSAITDLIETQLMATRLTRELLDKRSPIKHKPFHVNFQNGARIMGRIPQRDGKGVKGIHPVQLELDEAQDYPEPGWTELVETLKEVPGAIWRSHGVTRGVRDKFYEFTDDTNPNNDWKVHRYTAMHRPTWTDAERQKRIKQYGSRDDADYRRNVLGMHGDATNPLFVLRRLMACVDDDQSSRYNEEEYYHVTVRDSDLDHLKISIVDFLDMPAKHRNYPVIWGGMDVGLTSDPSEILFFAEYHLTDRERTVDRGRGLAVPDEGKSRLKLIARYTLTRISNPQQREAIIALLDHYQPRAFALDKTGIGLPLFQDLQAQLEGDGSGRARQRLERLKGYNFSEKVLVDFDALVPIEDNEDIDEAVKEAGITRLVLEYATDYLRRIVDEERLLLPWEKELVAEFQGQTFSYSKSSRDPYGRARRVFSEGRYHALDAARMAAMAHAQYAIEEFVKTPREAEPVYDRFGF